MIPDFDQHGTLPPGTYTATFTEIEERYGRPSISMRRERLTTTLKSLCKAVSEIAHKIYIDGSYITAKQAPSDVDVFIVVDHGYARKDPTGTQLLQHFVYSGKRYDLHVFVAPRSNNRLITKRLDWFTHTRDGREKGIISLE